MSKQKWNEQDVEDIICNPLVCGVGPFPPVVEDDKFVKAGAIFIAENGAEKYLTTLLKSLRKNLGKKLATNLAKSLDK